MTNNAKIKRIHGSFLEFATLAARSGVPRDTLERFIRARYIPQPRQLLFHAAAREVDVNPDLEEIAFGGARGGAKTHCTFAQVALDDCQRVPELKALFLRKKAGSAQEALNDLRRKVLRHTKHRPTVNKISFPNDSSILIGHFQRENDIDQYLGLEYDVIVVEEATQLTQTKIESIATTNRSSKPGFKPRMYLTTNPGGVGHTYFKKRFILPWKNKKERETRFIQSLVQDNLFNNPGYIKKLERLAGWMRRAWLEGDWDVFVGQYFDKFRYDEHTFDPEETGVFANGIPAGAEVWGAFDFGYQHWAIFYIFVKYEGSLYVLDEMACRQTINEGIAKNILETIDRNGLAPSQLRTIVAGGDVFQVQSQSGLTIADEFNLNGVYLNQANQARETGASKIVTLLGDSEKGIRSRVKISRRCQKLIECLPTMEHNEKKAGDVKKVDTDSEGRGGDDPYDGFRYGAMEDHGSTGLI